MEAPPPPHHHSYGGRAAPSYGGMPMPFPFPSPAAPPVDTGWVRPGGVWPPPSHGMPPHPQQLLQQPGAAFGGGSRGPSWDASFYHARAGPQRSAPGAEAFAGMPHFAAAAPQAISPALPTAAMISFGASREGATDDAEVAGGIPRPQAAAPLPALSAGALSLHARSADHDLRSQATRAGLGEPRATRIFHSSSATFGEVYNPFSHAGQSRAAGPPPGAFEHHSLDTAALIEAGPSWEDVYGEAEVIGGIPRPHAAAQASAVPPWAQGSSAPAAAPAPPSRQSRYFAQPGSMLLASASDSKSAQIVFGYDAVGVTETTASYETASSSRRLPSVDPTTVSSEATCPFPLADFALLRVGPSIEGSADAEESGGARVVVESARTDTARSLAGGTAALDVSPRSVAAPLKQSLSSGDLNGRDDGGPRRHRAPLSVATSLPDETPEGYSDEAPPRTAQTRGSRPAGISPSAAVVSSVVQLAGGISPDGAGRASVW